MRFDKKVEKDGTKYVVSLQALFNTEGSSQEDGFLASTVDYIVIFGTEIFHNEKGIYGYFYASELKQTKLPLDETVSIPEEHVIVCISSEKQRLEILAPAGMKLFTAPADFM